ncbi:putative spermidine/putrescine transport system substrate-binding protein [Phyllobacterium myrsinacearum]|uniref:ABC transporter substrate-binding protein n=1 Tax=Phyllobacterium myrsinacearum TaxID=28101 RepID=UPI00102A9900|nr:ABC transporter substrate-binding protein [Phyllobacterium myrsinacearum]RZS76817.1 putative spermidine/putrescine transport system substrate-binding protein [Phyllobacterium myrsinacearum]
MGTIRKKTGIWLAAASVFLIAGAASAAEVVVVSYGGTFQDAQTKAFFAPYAKASGVKITGTTGSAYAKVKAMVESGNVTWDVVSAESSAHANEVKDNLLEPLDYNVIKADGIPAQLRTKYGVGYITFGMNLAWDKEKFSNGISPSQFFDPAVKGRRVMPLEPEYTLEFALLADGVKAVDLYPLDVDRALKVIDRVKDQIVAYKGAADTQALIQQGEVDLAYIPNGRVNNAIKAGAKWAYGWDAAVSDTEWWVVVKGAPHPEEAMKFINFAVQPVNQAELTRNIAYGPTNVEALGLLDPDLAKALPSYPANAKLGAILDSKWWNDNRDTVKARWATYIMN